MAATFGEETISAPDFSRRWREVVNSNRLLLRQSRDLPSLRALLGFLEGRNAQCWCDQLDEYEAALKTLAEIARHSETLRGRIEEHGEEMAVWQKERQELERRKGEDWRQHLIPLIMHRDSSHDAKEVAQWQRQIDRQTAIRATAFEEPIAVCRERIAATRYLLAEFKRHRREMERGTKAAEARAKIAEITGAAQMARMELVRSAFLTTESLEHTQLRPTSWWLPLLDPTRSLV